MFIGRARIRYSKVRVGVLGIVCGKTGDKSCSILIYEVNKNNFITTVSK